MNPPDLRLLRRGDTEAWDAAFRWLWPVAYAVAEAIAIASLVVKHEPFRGFHVGARRKRARRPAAVTA